MRAVLLTLLLLLVGAPATGGAAQTITLPPTGTDWDYQLGGARPVPAHVGIVERDRRAAPVAGKYDICYVNGFQTQADEKAFWHRHWSLVLKRHGTPVVDSVWGEWLLDLRTSAERHALADIMGRWTDRCAADGYQAVEYDNQDSFTRSHHLLTSADANAYSRLLVARAHGAGLAAAQKNRAGWDGTTVGFDFAVAEQCGQYHECSSYVKHYGSSVLAVEYRDKAFAHTCTHWSDRIAVLRRDVDLTRHGTRRWC
ncbi:endo alpha-1,4 polygalactosaminidase [Nocardioides cynanchi]|uniref:endo alpha-1,4 polygalactosaminidase n=1 Tax=Nocardioides cynanchi TaxID=2558918 RepID=UPI0012478322|nr:endo alpha-1,4 polygalactosaminidase [Nocardioides cynanchi]